MRDGLRAALRQATAEVHASAETQVDLRADIETADGYEHFLRVMRSTTVRFAEPLDHSSRLSGLTPRSVLLLQALDRDLDHDQDGDDQLPHGGRDVVSDAWAIGVGYTLEGSSLGASVLLRRVPVGAATNYLDALVSSRRSRWTSYSRWLDGPEVAGHTTAEIVAGAAAVFVGVHEAIDAFAGPAPVGVQ